MKQGIVKTWVIGRGFGFIGGTGKDVYVHVTDVSDKTDLVVGEAVEYEVGEDRTGRPKAINVRRMRDGLDR